MCFLKIKSLPFHSFSRLEAIVSWNIVIIVLYIKTEAARDFTQLRERQNIYSYIVPTTPLVSGGHQVDPDVGWSGLLRCHLVYPLDQSPGVNFY